LLRVPRFATVVFYFLWAKRVINSERRNHGGKLFENDGPLEISGGLVVHPFPRVRNDAWVVTAVRLVAPRRGFYC
jgi:hypothetical protein